VTRLVRKSSILDSGLNMQGYGGTDVQIEAYGWDA